MRVSTYDLLAPSLIVVDLDRVVKTLTDHGLHDGAFLGAHELAGVVVRLRYHHVAVLIQQIAIDPIMGTIHQRIRRHRGKSDEPPVQTRHRHLEAHDGRRCLFTAILG